MIGSYQEFIYDKLLPLLKNKSANNPRKSEFLLNEVTKLQNSLNSDYRDKT
jgi:hypothetical protein